MDSALGDLFGDGSMQLLSLKTNMETHNGLEKVDSFKILPLFVFMLDFWGVHIVSLCDCFKCLCLGIPWYAYTKRSCFNYLWKGSRQPARWM